MCLEKSLSVPNFQQILLPLLRLTGDGEVHTLGGAIQALTSQMGLTEAEEKELLPSGR